MHRLLLVLAASLLPAPVPAQMPSRAPAWDPAAAYVTVGQDQAGYVRWIAAAGWRPVYVRAFDDYLVSQQVAGIVPTWQLLRTASSWQRCGAQPFEVPPSAEWPNLVETLRYVRKHVIPVVGPVEAVSGYRNPSLNVCAGGAANSAHRHYSAVDLVPLRPTAREAMIRSLCAIHAWQGGGFAVGLGFYRGLRFHIDSTKFRKWGSDASGNAQSCDLVIAQIEAQAAANRAARAAAALPVVNPQATPPAPTIDPYAPVAPAPQAVAPAPTDPHGRQN